MKIPERPNRINSEILKSVAAELQKICREYHQEIDDEDAAYIAEWHGTDNGYEIAKELEDRNCISSPDMSLVEALDWVSSHTGDVLKSKVKEWVKEHDIKLEYSIGDQVRIDLYTKNNVVGEIVKFYPETAQYGVWTECIGKPKCASNTRGYSKAPVPTIPIQVQ